MWKPHRADETMMPAVLDNQKGKKRGKNDEKAADDRIIKFA